MVGKSNGFLQAAVPSRAFLAPKMFEIQICNYYRASIKLCKVKPINNDIDLPSPWRRLNSFVQD